MAQYKAHPFYAIKVGNRTISFDFFGAYETDKQDEITVLDALCPVWVKRVHEPEQAEPKAEEPEAPAKPARKSSAK